MKAVSSRAPLDESKVNTNRGGTAGTARPLAQEVQTPMQVQRTYSRWYWFKWRLSKRLHLLPEAVTAAWYAQDCPPVLDASFLTRTERFRWAIDKWLRECNKRKAAA